MAHDNIIDEHILQLVQSQKICEQSDLKQLLKKRGFDIPQATISRRLKKFNIAKVAGIYTVITLDLPNIPIILNIQISEFGLIVLHTHPGHANSLAYYIDNKYVKLTANDEKNYGILGTIAGDDTVLLIIKSKFDLKNIINLLQEDFPYLKNLKI